MNALPRLTLILSVFLTLLTSASAALEFRVLSWCDSVDGLRFSDSRGETSLAAGERAFSPVYRWEGIGILELYRLESSSDGAPDTRVVVARLTPPPGLARGVLILNPAAGGRVEGVWLDDSAEDNPAGSIRLHNFSSHPLAVQAGAQNRLLTQTANTRIDFAATDRALPVQVAAEIGGEWRRVVSTSQPVRARYRLFVLLRDGRPTRENPVGPVEWLTFYEVPPAAEGRGPSLAVR